MLSFLLHAQMLIKRLKQMIIRKRDWKKAALQMAESNNNNQVKLTFKKRSFKISAQKVQTAARMKRQITHPRKFLGFISMPFTERQLQVTIIAVSLALIQ
jgi:hypothetical protein